MEQDLEGPPGCVYPMVQVGVHAEESLLFFSSSVRGLQLWAGVLGSAASLVQEVTKVWDATLLRAVAGSLDGGVDGSQGIVANKALEQMRINEGLRKEHVGMTE